MIAKGRRARQRCGEACKRCGRPVARARIGSDRLSVLRQDPAAAHGSVRVGPDVKHEVGPARAQHMNAQRGQHSPGRGAVARVRPTGPRIRHPPVGAPHEIGISTVLDASLPHRPRARGHQLRLLLARERVGGRGSKRPGRCHHHLDPAPGERLTQTAADTQVVGNNLSDGALCLAGGPRGGSSDHVLEQSDSVLASMRGMSSAEGAALRCSPCICPGGGPGG